jgi:hypothetical protein
MDQEDNVVVWLAHDEPVEFALPKQDFIPVTQEIFKTLKGRKREIVE